MRKAALALALMFCANVAVDSFDAGCVEEASCDACLCRSHVLPSPAENARRLTAPKPAFAAAAPGLLADRLIDKTIFRPPIVLA